MSDPMGPNEAMEQQQSPQEGASLKNDCKHNQQNKTSAGSDSSDSTSSDSDSSEVGTAESVVGDPADPDEAMELQQSLQEGVS